MKAYIYIIISFLIITSYACNQDKKLSEVTLISPNRTILVYMGGKNNLSPETYEKLNALKEGWKASTNGHLIVYHAPVDDTPKLLEIGTNDKGENVINTIEIYEKENSANPEVLTRVINTVVSAYPADSYGLIVFSHATGWLPGTNSSVESRAIIVDSNREMELIDFANALPDNVFDFIIMEACYMAGVEVAYQLKDKTEHIIASSAEILSPGFTEIYRKDISYLYDINPDLERFLQNSFNYFNSKSGDACSATFSLIHTVPLERLASFIKNNHIRPEDLNPEEIQNFGRYSSYQLFHDFKDYFIRTVADSHQQELLSNLLNECIITKNATSHFMPYSSGYEINKHSGLTTYIMQEQLSALNESYKELSWYQDVYGE